MLGKQEKEEMLADGFSAERREDFRKGRTILPAGRGLDHYIQFLMDIQKIFSPFTPSRKKTPTKFNKL